MISLTWITDSCAPFCPRKYIYIYILINEREAQIYSPAGEKLPTFSDSLVSFRWRKLSDVNAVYGSDLDFPV